MDNYTKIILTVIAVSMFKIAFIDISPINKTYAETKYNKDGGMIHKNDVTKIALCNEHGTACADIFRINKYPQKGLYIINSK